MYLLAKEDIYRIHCSTINEFGGDKSYYHDTDKKIESIINQQYGCFQYDKYPTIFNKSAMLMYFFIKNHCFVDGNKRVGLTSAITTLDINGYEDNLMEIEGYTKAMEIAQLSLRGCQIDIYIKSLSTWLEDRFKKDY